MKEGWSEVPHVNKNLKSWNRCNPPLNGRGCIHIIGNDNFFNNPWYIGRIQLHEKYSVKNKSIYTTKKHTIFKECVKDLENWWKELIIIERNTIVNCVW